MNSKKEIIILLPVYNDWASLNKLFRYIDNQAKKMSINFNALIVNDNSSKKSRLDIKNLKKIKKIEILNLKQNCGNQIAIAIGLRFLSKKKNISKIIVMDSDGEDSPFALNKMLEILDKNKEKFVFASRASRKENFILKFLNNLRLIFTFMMTGKYIDYGNFSCFNFSNLKKIINQKETYSAFCSSVTKFSKIIKVPVKKEIRYQGKSKANFKFLIMHSLNIINVFSFIFFLRSLFFIFVSFVFFKETDILYFVIVLFAILNCMNLYLIKTQKDAIYFNRFVKNTVQLK